jgi:glycine/D-amino acid oxidase-like deaminating enzyme
VPAHPESDDGGPSSRKSPEFSHYRGLSYWHDSVAAAGDALVPRPALKSDLTADVAIIGGGLTGLWTAYYLQQRDPGLRIAILEKEIAGFGASGRNGGWCSALFPRSTASLERTHGREAALAMRRAMIATVDELGRVAAAEGIDCDFVKGGTLSFVRDAVQRRSAEAELAEAAEYGVDELHWLGTSDSRRGSGGGLTGASARASARAPRLAVVDPNCARLHPGKLVRGLARVVESRGATIYEGTEVLDWRQGEVHTAHGTVTARSVIVATEGYGATLAQTKRDVLPLYSLMIATAPLSDETWERMGIEHGQTFTDYRHLLIYGQRTADNRFAFGGRGARYHWGSAIRPGYDRVERVFDHLAQTLVELFPQAAGVEITHRWGGPLGVPRDWHASVRYDPATGIGGAGGYVGDGLSTTNLAGRTLADLVTGTASDLTALPWVNHHSPRWEPEPLRFFGSNAGLVAMTIADAEEKITRKPSIAAKLMGPLTGH